MDGFHLRKNPFPRAGMKDSFKNAFPLDGKKKAFTGRSLWKIYKKWLVLARKSVSTTRNEAHSLKNTFPLYIKSASSG